MISTIFSMDFQYLYTKLNENPYLIVPACVLGFFLMKIFIFAAKVAFMPCGVNWTKLVGKKTSGKKTATANWAAVSGASDGIGKEFALQLAKKGFNILLIGRNPEKLEQVETDIKKTFNVKTDRFILDYANAEDEDFELLQEKCSKLAITVLINNAGVSHVMPTPFIEESRETLNQIIKVNCTSTVQVTRSILPGMIKGGRGGLILNMGSVSAELKTPLLQTYAGSKAFLSIWSQALADEVAEHGIHVELLNTHFVTTNMSKIRRSSWSCPTPKSYVKCVLSRCGNGRFSTLHPGHAIVIGAMSLIPDWILRSLTLKQMKATRKHALAKAAKLTTKVK